MADPLSVTSSVAEIVAASVSIATLLFLVIDKLRHVLKAYNDKTDKETAQKEITVLINDNQKELKRHLETTVTLVRELHDWHRPKDDDQVFVWYVRRDLRGAVESLVSAAQKQNTVLDKLLKELTSGGQKDSRNSSNIGE